MDAAAIHALYPYDCLLLEEALSAETILSKIKQASGRIFLLPREAYKTPNKVRDFVKKGACLLIRRSDIKNSQVSADERDALIEAFGGQVFIQGYSPASSSFFIGNGASILIDGKEPDGGMPAESIRKLIQELGSDNMVKLSRFELGEAFLLDSLKKKVKLVFSCLSNQDCDRALLSKCLLLGVPNLLITASDFSSSELEDYLQKGATIVITGQDKMPINAIKTLAFPLEEEPIPAQRRLKVFPDKGLSQHLPDLQQLHDDQKIELLKDHKWYFNTSRDRVIA